MLQFLIEDRKTNQRAVALGSGMHVSTMSEILSGGRQMNLDHMRKLAGSKTRAVTIYSLFLLVS